MSPSRVHVLPCGGEDCDKGSLTLLKDCGKILRAPYHAYLIEDPECTILVDTGACINWKERHPKELQKISPVYISENEHLDQLIGSVGFSTSDVDYVINTHLHYDHCGNNEMFDKATFVVNEGELAHALSPGWWESLNYVRAVFDLPQLRYETVTGEFDVHPGVKILQTPGHTEGHQSVVVQLEKTGTLILAGDAIYLRENLDTPILPGIYVDARRYAESMRKLSRIVRLQKGTMLLSHSRDYLSPNGWGPLKQGVHTFQ